MKKQFTLKLDGTASFNSLTKEYFKTAGFTLANESQNQLSFTKGNTLHNLVALNPLNWKCRVDISLDHSTVVADFDVSTFGQNVTPNEEKLWDAFVERYKLSLLTKSDTMKDNRQLVTEIKKDNWQFAKAAVLGAVVFGVPSGFLSYYTGVSILASMGAAMGAALFVKFKIDQQKSRLGR